MSFTRGKLYFSDSSSLQTLQAEQAMLRELPNVGIVGANVTSVTGIFEGKAEFGFVLETLDTSIDEGEVSFLPMVSKLEELAEFLRKEFFQTSVLVSAEVVNGRAIFVQETNK